MISLAAMEQTKPRPLRNQQQANEQARALLQSSSPSESPQTIHLPKKKRSHAPARYLKSHRSG
jgi:hypothetical protein